MQPFVFMSSIFILSLNAKKNVFIPEPGQAIHKCVSCSLCHAIMIFGWRYKCGSVSEDLNFDENCLEKYLLENPIDVVLII